MLKQVGGGFSIAKLVQATCKPASLQTGADCRKARSRVAAIVYRMEARGQLERVPHDNRVSWLLAGDARSSGAKVVQGLFRSAKPPRANAFIVG